MLELRAEHALVVLVENMLPVGTQHGLYIRMRATMTNYGATKSRTGGLIVCPDPHDNETPAESTRYFHFLFSRLTNYTKVWAYTGSRFEAVKPEQWKMTSYHDSCWRSDGFRTLDEGYASMREDVVPHNEGRTVPKVSMFTDIDAVQQVQITDANSQDEGRPHHRVVLAVTHKAG